MSEYEEIMERIKTLIIAKDIKCKDCKHWTPYDSHGFGDVDTVTIDDRPEAVGICNYLRFESYRFDIELDSDVVGSINKITTTENFFCADHEKKI